MPEATLSIGEVAEKAGIAISAIRYYERNGLLPEAAVPVITNETPVVRI